MRCDQPSPLRLVTLICAGITLVGTACAPLTPTVPAHAGPVNVSGSGKDEASLHAYLAFLASLDAGQGPGEHSIALATAKEAWQASPGPQATLRYALALGSPGHAASDPAEAVRLISALLSPPAALSAEEVQLASVFMREFATRQALSAEIARQHDEFEERLRVSEASSHATLATLNAETTRLRREVNMLKEKLNAIAEIEQSLMQQDVTPAPPTNDGQ
jgi:hypothetical protein